jgi:hypothetical protein
LSAALQGTATNGLFVEQDMLSSAETTRASLQIVQANLKVFSESHKTRDSAGHSSSRLPASHRQRQLMHDLHSIFLARRHASRLESDREKGSAHRAEKRRPTEFRVCEPTLRASSLALPRALPRLSPSRSHASPQRDARRVSPCRTSWRPCDI